MSGIDTRTTRTFVAWVAFALVLLGALAVQQPGRRESSDAFWSLAYSRRSIEAERYGSIEDMTGAADAVVVGTIEKVERGRTFVADPQIAERGRSDPYYDHAFAYYAVATVRVTEVISGGGVQVGATVPLEIFASQKPKLEGLLASGVSDRGVFFLRSKGIEAKALALSADIQAADAPYFRLVTRYGLVREFGGRAAPIGSEAFLESLDDSPFTEVVSTVKEAASGS